jgi:ATP-dependent DNA helicase RecG
MLLSEEDEMDTEELESQLALLRSYGAEDGRIEAKRAERKLPESVVDTLSAFANTTGGLILLGVDEAAGFAVTGVADPAKVLADLCSVTRDRVTPPLQPSAGLGIVEGKTVVWAQINELPRIEKPCYVTSRGLHRGSYIRLGDGDRRLTSEEVQQLIADRGQPQFDVEVVESASVSDLDQHGITELLRRVRQSSPRPFSSVDDTTALKMLNVLRPAQDGSLRPTLAALLALGIYPQQFFPQLNLTFVHHPTTTGSTQGSVRFIDNVRVEGPVPLMVKDSLAVIQRNMTRRAEVVGYGRRDVWEYPPEALREAIVNALVHRDFSPGTRGMQVQIEMYPDRLTILNPGGLFGAVDIAHLGEGASSSRNSVLLKILEDVVIPGEAARTICENRGSGIRTMREELKSAGMGPPDFFDRVTSFLVKIPNYTLFDDDTVSWLKAVGPGLKDTQRMALALMRHGRILDNAGYRAATGQLDSRQAYRELQELVARELVEQTGDKNGARYSLSDYATSLLDHNGARKIRPNRRSQIIELLRVRKDLSKTEVSDLLGISPKTVEHYLRELRRGRMVESTGARQGSKNTRYRLTAEGAQGELFS